MVAAVRVLVCGSRGLTDRAWIRERLRLLPHDAEILHGNARDVDRIAGSIANELSMSVRVFPADWESYGKRAGYLRNIEMLDAQPDLVIAFWDGSSRGTKHAIDAAGKRGIPVEVITP